MMSPPLPELRAGATRPGCDGVTCCKPDRRQRLLGAKKIIHPAGQQL